MIGRQEEKLQRLYYTYLDKLSIAQTMRENLASDIKAGYGMNSVVKQMVEIEQYEKITVKNAEKDFNDYREKIFVTEKDFLNLKDKWEKIFLF